jgi:hypothetical protein
VAAAAAAGGVAAMAIGEVKEVLGAQVCFFELVEQGLGGLGREWHLAPNSSLGTPKSLLIVKVVVHVLW